MFSYVILIAWICYFLYGTFPNVREPIKVYYEYDNPSSSYYNTTNQTLLDQLQEGKYLYHAHLIVDVVFFSYFLVDFLLRFSICTRKKLFVLNILNIFDFLSIFLFWIFFFIHFGLETEALFFARRIFESLRFFCLFRVFKLHWKLRTIAKTFAVSTYELVVCFLTIFIFTVTVSTITFYCEVDNNPWFYSVPATFWWTVITITGVIFISFKPFKRIGFIKN